MACPFNFRLVLECVFSSIITVSRVYRTYLEGVARGRLKDNVVLEGKLASECDAEACDKPARAAIQKRDTRKISTIAALNVLAYRSKRW